MKQKDIASYENHNLYVACFSQEKDSLPMWNYYLKNGKYEGYSLGFDVDIQEFLVGKAINKRKVIYEDEAKQKMITHLILEAASAKGKNITNEEICRKLIKAINELSLVMKKECFAHEKEVRLILDLDLAQNQNTNDLQDSDEIITFNYQNIEYFTKNGILIPYCDVSLKDKSILKEICYAPTMLPEQTELGLMSFLGSNGYNISDIHIYPSEIPVRY